MPRALGSKIILCKDIKMDREYNNVIDYTEQNMVALCQANKIIEKLGYSYIRHQNTIQTDFTMAQCLKANYIAFQNPDYSNKWFFAFIDDVKYIGENNTEISYTIDVWSTWYEKLIKKKCWVEREHVADDTIGLHTLDEGLKCVNFEVLNATYDSLYLVDPYIVVMSTYDPEDDSNMSGATVWNGVVNGAKAFIFRFNIQQQTRGVMDFENFLMLLNARDKLNAVQNIYVVPAAVLGYEPPDGDLLTPHTASYSILPTQTITTNYYKLDGFTSVPKTFVTSITHFDDNLNYVPKNNKCLCFPYHYLYVTNNCGNSNIYKAELFNNRSNIEFLNELVLTPGVSGRITPLNYKNWNQLFDESVPLGKFPNCGWANDEYINWLTKNAINEPTKILNNLLGVQSSYNSTQTKKATNLDVAKGGVGTVTNVADVIGDFYSASLLTSTSAGSNTGDVNFASSDLRFDYYSMILKDEELKIIDDYFTRFGYKVNELKIPEFSSRVYWNFIKIVDGENIGYGEIPSKAMEIINNVCRNGVTIWHNHANIGNYNLNNSIVQ